MEDNLDRLEAAIALRQRHFAQARSTGPEGTTAYAPTQAEEVLEIAVGVLNYTKALHARLVALEQRVRVGF